MLPLYKTRIRKDVERWHANGWISDQSRDAIAGDIARGGRGITLAPALGILASVLFGFAAISFVAAHWEEVPRLGRFGLLLALIWTGYGAAGWLAQRGHRAFADAAILFSVAMFGASIMLVSQMYNIAGDPADGVLMWWIGALLAGVLLRSNPALAFAIVLVALWAFMQTWDRNDVYWPFLIGWALVSAAFLWQRWRPGLHLSALALSVFVVSIGYLLGNGHEHTAVAVAGIIVAVVAAGIEKARLDFDTIAAPILGYAIAVAFAGLFALQFIETTSGGTLLALAALTLFMLLAAISHGVASGNRGVLWIGYIAFSVEILSLYWQTVGSILGTSLFFLIAAVIVTALAYVALRIAQRGSTKDVAA